jgi:hypothetical protein
VTTSIQNVTQVVGQVAIFQAAPKEIHVLAIYRIFRYLKGTTNFGLWYPKENELTMVTYTDSYWVGSIDDRRITRRVAFYLGDFMVSWLSKI